MICDFFETRFIIFCQQSESIVEMDGSVHCGSLAIFCVLSQYSQWYIQFNALLCILRSIEHLPERSSVAEKRRRQIQKKRTSLATQQVSGKIHYLHSSTSPSTLFTCIFTRVLLSTAENSFFFRDLS